MTLYDQANSIYEKARREKLVGLKELKALVTQHAANGSITLKKKEQENGEWPFVADSLKALQGEGFKILCLDSFGNSKLDITLFGIVEVTIDWKESRGS